jgi:hypothetical protein
MEIERRIDQVKKDGRNWHAITVISGFSYPFILYEKRRNVEPIKYILNQEIG